MVLQALGRWHSVQVGRVWILEGPLVRILAILFTMLSISYCWALGIFLTIKWNLSVKVTYLFFPVSYHLQCLCATNVKNSPQNVDDKPKKRPAMALISRRIWVEQELDKSPMSQRRKNWDHPDVWLACTLSLRPFPLIHLYSSLILAFDLSAIK